VSTDRLLVAVFASPVSEVLLRWGAELGFRTVLVEPDPGRVPAGTPDVTVRSFADLEELGGLVRDALARPARWIGVMGNPRHEGPHVAALTALGVPPEEIARVHRPIGLDIGSKAPAEIALSTLAGLLADRNGRSGGFAHGG
jgi:xanthine dehydrogenase accessory factor